MITTVKTKNWKFFYYHGHTEPE